jgi:enoyl-CoA hydratase/carnithine racemase
MSTAALTPPRLDRGTVTFPAPNIMLVTLTHTSGLNCLNSLANHQLARLWTWFDAHDALAVAIITGTGRAFCAGADLKEWDNKNAAAGGESFAAGMPASGFAGLSLRRGKKPIIAAVNGICFGGGCEATINTDIVLASANASFSLPEVKRGVVALAGALPRLVRTVGRQRAMEMALTGRVVPAEEAERWGLINKVVAPEQLLPEALRIAEEIAGNSPDSVIVTREGLKAGWDGMGVHEATARVVEEIYYKMDKGENMKEGVRAFVEKRKPKWVPSKL